MSDSVPAESPATRAFQELETLVRHLGDELAAFRRRALTAEARLRELDGGDGAERRGEPSLAERCATLEAENAALEARLAAATSQTRQMLERVRFIRQQSQSAAESR